MTQSEFDYIIVGAGSAGCVLANRLSAGGSATVCVIEGGGSESAPNVTVPAGILSLYGNPKYDYAYVGTPQPELMNRRIPVNRGKALGGSSTINSMVFIRGACSDYDAWRDLGCANLAVLTGTQTHRVVLNGARATGVEISDASGRWVLRARREVILSAGAIGSPTILMRSGIGPAAMLKAAGVAVAHDLPGVGQNLRDHIDGMITVRSRSTKTLGLSRANLPAMIAAPFRYLFARKGMLSTNYVEAGGFARTKFAGSEPDIQFHFVPGYRSHRGRLVEYGHGYAVHTCVLRPKSVGEIRLAKDGGAEIDHRFVTDPQDAATLVEGIRIARAIFADAAFDAVRGPEMLPGPKVQSDAEILAYLRAEALTVYHPVGTCKMGTDALAVTDPATLKVRGIEGLRVADASVMPTLIGGNTNVPSMMIGERCARMVLSA